MPNIHFQTNYFFFKEVKYNHFDIYKRNKQVKELIGITENVTQSLKVNHELVVPYTKEKSNSIAKETECIRGLENDEVKIYRRKKRKLEKEILSTERKFNNEGELSEKKRRKKKERKKKLKKTKK